MPVSFSLRRIAKHCLVGSLDQGGAHTQPIESLLSCFQQILGLQLLSSPARTVPRTRGSPKSEGAETRIARGSC
jgi:hypothetical protein